MTTQANNNNKVVNASKAEIIEVTGVEVTQPRTVQDFYSGVDKANQLFQLHTKYLTRIKEIREFKNTIADGGSIQLYIEHVSGKQIEFPHVKIVNDFINMQLENGEKELEDLEVKIKNFKI